MSSGWAPTHVILPTDPTKSDGVDILIEDDGEGDDKAEDGEALGTKVVGEDLEGIRYNQGGEGNGVRSGEQEDEGNDCMSGGFVPGDRVTSRTDGLEDEEKQHADARGHKKDPPPDAFNERSGTNSPSEAPDLEDTIDEELDGRVGNSNGLEHFIEVVRDETIAGPLGEPTEGDDYRQTFTVPRGLDQGHPTNGRSDSRV